MRFVIVSAEWRKLAVGTNLGDPKESRKEFVTLIELSMELKKESE